MKRQIIVIFVVIGIVAVCIYARHRAGEAREMVHFYALPIFFYIEQQDGPGAQKAVEALVAYWEREQRYLMIFSRHTEIDELSRTVSRLKSYAIFEEFADLHAELRAVLWQIDHIWETERVRVGTILL